ncbi:MAG: hypothetical protein OEZ43_13610 [Gammaproteobacteria bacterium]|nr:hypothetical protein [Gammaproteobacteria bacterium]
MKKSLGITGLFLMSLISTNSFADDEVPFYVLSAGGQSAINHQMTMVVDSPMHWEHLWKMHTANSVEEVVAPKVDFDNEVVIAQFLGQVASCGYAVATEEVEDKGSYLKVESRIKTPEGPIYCLVAEQPYEMITVPRTGMLFSFESKIGGKHQRR